MTPATRDCSPTRLEKIKTEFTQFFFFFQFEKLQRAILKQTRKDNYSIAYDAQAGGGRGNIEKVDTTNGYFFF